MVHLSRPRVIECFHLAFLGVLGARIEPARYVLKGGANLRYFFESARYSEDIDIDIDATLSGNLESKIDGILASKPLEYLLRTRDLEVDGASKPKQTDITRRWKVAITAPGHEPPVRTKVEFSNRNGERRCTVEPVPDRIVAGYGIAPPVVQHYQAQAALEQKVRALAGRSETQARDIFDLALLMRTTTLAAGAVEADVREQALERGLALPREAFLDQVLPFLDPDVAELYPEASWVAMRDFVAGKLLEDS